MSGPPAGRDDEFDDLLRQTASYYTVKLRAEGPGARGMDWRDAASQYLRFERLTLALERTPQASLLDVGCGSGELLAYCRRDGWSPAYLGIDVSEEMVAACNRRFGEGTARHATLAEIAREGRRFDHVVASGTFNVRQRTPEEEWRRYFHRSVVTMFELADRAAVFNVMSSRVDRRYEHLYYADLPEISELADRCGTRRFLIDHAYPLFEMTVTLLATAPGPR